MQVPLFDIDHDAAGPPCAPYPATMLILGGYRWLGMDGQLKVITPDKADFAEDWKRYAEEDGEDPQVTVGAAIFWDVPVPLTSRTLAFWEAAAVSGGYVLSDLIV